MKTRIIQTRFWKDTFISELNPKTKLLFIYLLSNERIELTGAYEVPLRYIAMETGLTLAEVEKGFSEIESKIKYKDGYVVVLNSQKYQDYSRGSSHQKNAFDREYENLPEEVKWLLDNKEQLVPNQSTTSCITSPGLDRNKKQEIRNKKTEIRNKKIWNKKTLENGEISKKLQEEGFDEKLIKEEVAKMIDWLDAEGKTKIDYLAFARNWLRRAISTKGGNSKWKNTIPKI